ncbi:MAG: hypothetical protein HPAVJP_2220 [Candidatus Hepatoplasma vulgare]|nr:MAG: hypothetical protein HPAVJP_2220 [Candidatus Hepatoplasma sp.]
MFDSIGEAFYSIIIWVVIAFLITQIILFFYKDKILIAVKNNKKTEVIFASFLGIIPGCAGSIFLIPLYKEKIVSFGALIAAFITTLGETTFVILLFNPMAFLIFTLLSIITSIIVGYLVNIFKIEEKLKINIEISKTDDVYKHVDKKNLNKKAKKKLRPESIKAFEMADKIILPCLLLFFTIILFPLTIITSFIPDNSRGAWVDTYITVGNYIALIVFFVFVPYKLIRDFFEKRISDSHDYDHYHTLHSNDEHTEVHKKHRNSKKEEFYHEFNHTFITLVFIIFWVYLSMILIGLIVYAVNASSNSDFSNASDFAIKQKDIYRFLIILIALSISLIPVCGPQIFLVTLFGQGYIAFSALSANSISQNGHAGLAMLSVDKKSYLWMKGIILIPAIIIGMIFFTIEITMGTTGTSFSNWINSYNRSIS